MPQHAGVLPAASEAERLQNPAATAVQIARAKRIERTWGEIEKTGRRVAGSTAGNRRASRRSWAASSRLHSARKKRARARARKTEAAGADAADKQLLLGNELVRRCCRAAFCRSSAMQTQQRCKANKPSLRVAPDEIDYRRGLWFVIKFGAGNKPAPAPGDVEIRTAEAANKLKSGY